jgi:hypothetical protein
MLKLHPQYIIDEKSIQQAVIIQFSEWNNILEKLEELDDIEIYDIAKKQQSEIISFEEAVKEIKTGIIT